MLPLQEGQVQFLVRKLRPYIAPAADALSKPSVMGAPISAHPITPTAASHQERWSLCAFAHNSSLALGTTPFHIPPFASPFSPEAGFKTLV